MTSRVAALCQLTIAITKREGVGAVCEALAARANMEPWQVEETILQGIPYSGIPGAVEALGAWRDVCGQQAQDVSCGSEQPGADLESLGAGIFQEVYGDQTERVRSELERRHPALERWIIEFAYGRVMGRGRLPHAEVEALGVASLMAQGRKSPLYSHVRGALRCGWGRQEFRDLIDEIAAEIDPEIVEYVADLMK